MHLWNAGCTARLSSWPVYRPEDACNAGGISTCSSVAFWPRGVRRIGGSCAKDLPIRCREYPSGWWYRSPLYAEQQIPCKPPRRFCMGEKRPYLQHGPGGKLLGWPSSFADGTHPNAMDLSTRNFASHVQSVRTVVLPILLQ